MHSPNLLKRNVLRGTEYWLFNHLGKLWKIKFLILCHVIFLWGCRGNLKLITFGSEKVLVSSSGGVGSLDRPQDRCRPLTFPIGHYQNEREAGSESLSQVRLGSFGGTGLSINPTLKHKCRGSTIAVYLTVVAQRATIVVVQHFCLEFLLEPGTKVRS